jgi:F-type H+-transporting ATPase subunit c
VKGGGELAIIAVGAGMAVSIAGIGGGIGMGLIGGKSVEIMSKRPDEGGNIRTISFISLAFIETLTIYGLLIALMLISINANLGWSC